MCSKRAGTHRLKRPQVACQMQAGRVAVSRYGWHAGVTHLVPQPTEDDIEQPFLGQRGAARHSRQRILARDNDRVHIGTVGKILLQNDICATKPFWSQRCTAFHIHRVERDLSQGTNIIFGLDSSFPCQL